MFRTSFLKNLILIEQYLNFIYFRSFTSMSKSRKLKAFLPVWTDKFLKDCDCEHKIHCDCPETIPVKDWFTADPSNVLNAKCLCCPKTTKMPFGRTFSIAEGFSAIQKHAKTKDHITSMKKKNESEGRDQMEQISIFAAMKNQEELNEKSRKETNQLLKSQIMFSHFVHAHGLPSESFTCFSELVPDLFPDPDSDAMKENLTTISMDEGTSAEEVKEAVFSYLDSLLIPLSNIMTVSTDGCSTMLGDEGGVHELMRQRIPHLPHWGGCRSV